MDLSFATGSTCERLKKPLTPSPEAGLGLSLSPEAAPKASLPKETPASLALKLKAGHREASEGKPSQLEENSPLLDDLNARPEDYLAALEAPLDALPPGPPEDSLAGALVKQAGILQEDSPGGSFKLLPGPEGEPLLSFSRVRSGLGRLRFETPASGGLRVAVVFTDGSQTILGPGRARGPLQCTKAGVVDFDLAGVRKVKYFSLFGQGDVPVVKASGDVFAWSKAWPIFHQNATELRVVLSCFVVEGEVALRPTNLCFPTLQALAGGLGLASLVWESPEVFIEV